MVLSSRCFLISPNSQVAQTPPVTFAWGMNTDRGMFGIGAEYVETTKAALADRDWTNDCSGNVEIDENGDIRRDDLFWLRGLSVARKCELGAPAMYTIVNAHGLIFFLYAWVF